MAGSEADSEAGSETGPDFRFLIFGVELAVGLAGGLVPKYTSKGLL